MVSSLLREKVTCPGWDQEGAEVRTKTYFFLLILGRKRLPTRRKESMLLRRDSFLQTRRLNFPVSM